MYGSMKLVKIPLVLIIFLAILLRLFQLNSVPLGLSWDEASLGYNAYAIATTLHDEHGEFLPVARFMAFGDYKPPGYIYVSAVAVKLLGLSEFSTRLPSALAGTLLVVVAYFLVKELLRRESVALLTAFVVAISPWALQFSHAAFEANLATAFSATGILFFLVALRKKPWVFFSLASVFLVASTYTFNSHRIFVPLILVALTLIYFKAALKNWKVFIVLYGLFFILFLPQVPFLLSQEGKLRFNEVAWINDLEPLEEANLRVAIDDNSVLGKIVHNRRVVYGLQFLEHYTDTFRSQFLFISGDVNPRLSIQSVGEMYLLELPLLLLGIFFLAKKHSKSGLVLLAWTLLAPLPGALARETPHALRTLTLLPVPQICVAAGVFFLADLLRKYGASKKVATLIILGGYTISFAVYLHDFYIAYPQISALEWQYGYKQMVKKVSSLASNYDSISVTETYGRPYIYFLFHENHAPKDYLISRNVDRDWYGFWYVRSFGPYVFGAQAPKGSRVLYVRGPNEPAENTREIGTINNTDGEVIFVLSESK